jgi:hypothetical protein
MNGVLDADLLRPMWSGMGPPQTRPMRRRRHAQADQRWAGTCCGAPLAGLPRGWARLGQRALEEGDAVAACAFVRTGYHRRLDRLRAQGWGGVGTVRWAQPSNRGFLRSLHC